MKIIIISAMLFSGLTSQCFGQQSVVTTGGLASGSGGTLSYSVGQVLYSSTNTNSNGYLIQGVQQPYDTTIITGIDPIDGIEISIYPNPVNNFLQINLKDHKLKNLRYDLIDLQGRVLQSEKINSNEITLKMEALPKSIYFLKVNNGNKTMKTFKFIKN